MLRQAQLKLAYAQDYPAMTPGLWYTAAAAAGLVKATRILREGPAVKLESRLLSPTQFEFRGGDSRRGSWVGLKTRRIDRGTYRSH